MIKESKGNMYEFVTHTHGILLRVNVLMAVPIAI